MRNILGKTLFWLGYPLVYVVLRRSRRALVLITSGEQILLVKNVFDGKDVWTLPGGGIKGSETAKNAAQRELREELSCVVDPTDLRELGEESTKSMGITFNTIFLSLPSERKRTIKKNWELSDASWFAIKDLPERRKPLIDSAILRLQQG